MTHGPKSKKRCARRAKLGARAKPAWVLVRIADQTIVFYTLQGEFSNFTVVHRRTELFSALHDAQAKQHALNAEYRRWIQEERPDLLYILTRNGAQDPEDHELWWVDEVKDPSEFVTREDTW